MKRKNIIVGTILTVCVITFSVILINNQNINKYQNNNIKTKNNIQITNEMNAKSLSYDNSKTGLDCKDAQCVIDTLTKTVNEKISKEG